MESIRIIYTGASITTRVRLTLVDLIFTLRSTETGFADTFIAVDAVFADPIVTRVARTVIKVDFTVCA